MVVRIVKMTFREEHVPEFQRLFAGWKARIRAFPGCRHLELLHDTADPRVFFTYSHWDDADCLERYRRSAVFSEVWPTVKPLFAAPTETWTVAREDLLP